MMRELEALRAVTENPARPSVAILGGAKVSDKIGVIRNLLTKVDTILIGGAMAYTFLKARGYADRQVAGRRGQARPRARADRRSGAAKRARFVLPSITSSPAAPEAGSDTADVTEIPPEMMGLDIGPRTVAGFHRARSRAPKPSSGTGRWDSSSIPAFAHGTMRVGEALANHVGRRTQIIGGGDTAAAVAQQPWANKFTHISTGGGATLEYLEGSELPGVKALEV